MPVRAPLLFGLVFVTGCCCGKTTGPSEKPADQPAEPRKAGSPSTEAEPRGSGNLETVVARDEIIRQMVQAEFERRLEDAERLLAAGQYDAALAAVDRAEQVVRANALYLPSRGGVFTGHAEHFRSDIRNVRDRKVDAGIRAGKPYTREKL